MTSLEENKAIIRRLLEAENKRNLAILNESIAPDFIEERNIPFELRGPEGYKQFMTTPSNSFPDNRGDLKRIHLKIYHQVQLPCILVAARWSTFQR